MLTWDEIALRLGLTVIAGGLVGYNRSSHGQQAGLRTNILVCLAAAISMIQANLLLGTVGKASNSFVVLDLMRLPLGILSGMGFIGAGAVMHKDNLVIGVTTAATLWFVTVMGLCFGGGQITLGLIALAVSLAVLSGLKHVEQYCKQERRGTLRLVVAGDTMQTEDIEALLENAGFKINGWSVEYLREQKRRALDCEVRWRAAPRDARPPDFLKELQSRPEVIDLSWKPTAILH